jgi:hypothetical protein
MINASDMIGTLNAYMPEILNTVMNKNTPDNVIPSNEMTFVMDKNNLLCG